MAPGPDAGGNLSGLRNESCFFLHLVLKAVHKLTDKKALPRGYNKHMSAGRLFPVYGHFRAQDLSPVWLCRQDCVFLDVSQSHMQSSCLHMRLELSFKSLYSS